MHPAASEIINNLNLAPHPEGGYFREVYRSEDKIRRDSLPERYNSDRIFSTSIYFLLEGEQVSRFHRLRSDEIWYYHSGSSALIYIIEENGHLVKKRIGRNISAGDEFQVIIRRNSWFAAEVEDNSSYLLAGCLVSPGFEFADFELGERDTLLDSFPGYSELIRRFT